MEFNIEKINIKKYVVPVRISHLRLNSAETIITKLGNKTLLNPPYLSDLSPIDYNLFKHRDYIL